MRDLLGVHKIDIHRLHKAKDGGEFGINKIFIKQIYQKSEDYYYPLGEYLTTTVINGSSQIHF